MGTDFGPLDSVSDCRLGLNAGVDLDLAAGDAAGLFAVETVSFGRRRIRRGVCC